MENCLTNAYILIICNKIARIVGSNLEIPLFVSSSTGPLVGILDKMERDQLITRVRSEQDKRCYHFFLTEKAKHACRELEKQGILMQNLSAGNLPDKEVRKLNENLLSIIENLERIIENIRY